MRGLPRRLLYSLIFLTPLLIAATPAQAGQILPDWWRWWHWLILFLIFVPFALWRTIVAAWGDAPPPPPPPAQRVPDRAAPARPAATAAPTAPVASPPPAAAAAPAPTPAATAAMPGDIPPPALIEITDDMDPAAVRKARIANARATAAYKKALKEAGIAPATVEDSTAAPAPAPAPAPATSAAADPAPTAPSIAAAVASGETKATITTAPDPGVAAALDEEDGATVEEAEEAEAPMAEAASDDKGDDGPGDAVGVTADAPSPTGAPESPAVAAAHTSAVGAPPRQDLRKVEGIGPKIAALLSEAGIHSFAQLAETHPEQLKAILDAAGPRYRLADPTSWGQQAALAAAEKWDELAELQNTLKGGRAR